MRKLLLLLAVLCSDVSMAQTFLGVKYGTPYANALSTYKEKYHSNCESYGESVIIITPKVGSVVFDCGTAWFSFVNGQSVLDGGVLFLVKPLSQRNIIEARMKDMITLLEKKYGEDTYFDKETEILWFGKSLRVSDDWLGSLMITEEPNDGICALVLNYRKIMTTDTDDL